MTLQIAHRRLPLGVLVLALTGIGGIGMLDFRFGQEISLFIFYFIPVGIATWYVNRRAGNYCALLATLPLFAELAGMLWALRLFLRGPKRLTAPDAST